MAGIIDFTVGIMDFTAVIMGIGVAIMDFTVTATMGPEEEVAIKRSRAFAHYGRER